MGKEKVEKLEDKNENSRRLSIRYSIFAYRNRTEIS